ncbi:MAG: DUF1844 domain-containing protein [Desulfobacter postgatei]|uniref:DUF1844 domain-containing protein n=1 Tax=Desulfobacter postgatei TaxID=2293 RepID=UPI0023F485B2|nr:DUF1844 domain-containing protein [Desulfobacter postgatei]MDD4272491.1 DUF1844 domain-containing protein [Desulfobacter postgatei]
MAQGDGFIMKEAQTDKSAYKNALPRIDFSSFILSLYSSGLVQLGIVEDPSTGKKTKNLEIAKHTIDMIAMLQEKTSGNLNGDEQNLLKALLSELRIAYVEARS